MLLQRLLKKQYASLNGYHSGELVNRLVSDVRVVRNGIMDVVPGLFSMGVSFVGASVILFSMDWRFAVVLIVSGLVGLALMALFRNPMKKRHHAVQETEARLHAGFQETLEHLQLVKASGSEQRMMGQTQRLQEQYRTAQIQKEFFSASMHGAINTVLHFSWLFCMLWGCVGIYQGRLTYGMLLASIQLVGQIQGPMVRTANVAGQIYGMIGSAERLHALMELPEETVTGESLASRYDQLTEIRLQDVSFSYEREAEHVLRHINICIRPGDIVAVTGISGEGKSTIFQLLLGIYTPLEGQVQVCFQEADGAVLQVPVSSRTRGLFAYVPQGNTLFSGTLRDNFSMFADGLTDGEIMKAAEIACIDKLVYELQDGLDTVIGERGIGLSEGQAQRVAVARALLSKAPILLLDESTSALDEETEARLLHNIALLEHKTCLIVTHRKAAMKICDYEIHIANAQANRLELNHDQDDLTMQQY